MKSRADGFGYNERLFAGGFRSRLHFARFNWFMKQMKTLRCRSECVLELGCFDGKLIGFLPTKPSRYVGFDANWEGGLDLAARRWQSYPNFSFHKASKPDEMSLDKHERFDVAVVMETLEHVPPHLVDGYLHKIAQHLDGYLFVTVPNEKGIVFLAKWMIKKLLTEDVEQYSLAEIVNATLGRMAFVARREHKGFDYSALVKEIDKYFDVIKVSGHPIGFLPGSLCFGIGIVAKTRAIPKLV
jgi:2-polyprenyl-3-methyl-5-hydroxy-6-metoxy-1,4-benzoquinol methylase